MIKKIIYFPLIIFCLTCVCVSSSEALVVEGPLLDLPEEEWDEFGLIIRAESDVLLVSVRYPNQGLSDTIELRLHTDGNLLSSIPVPPGNPDVIVEINYPLTAGELYELVSTTPNNRMYNMFSQWPVGNSDITVLSSYGFGTPHFLYWFAFNDITTQTSMTSQEPEQLEISIDIKPGSNPNSINLNSRGVVPVAILSTEIFDAYILDPASIVFAGAEPLRWTMADVDNDGNDDMLLHFKTQHLLDLNENSTEAMLTGMTTNGILVEGMDSVKIVPKKK